MKTIGIILVALMAIGLYAREYTWRVKAAVFAALIVMVIVLIRQAP